MHTRIHTHTCIKLECKKKRMYPGMHTHAHQRSHTHTHTNTKAHIHHTITQSDTHTHTHTHTTLTQSHTHTHTFNHTHKATQSKTSNYRAIVGCDLDAMCKIQYRSIPGPSEHTDATSPRQHRLQTPVFRLHVVLIPALYSL